MSRSTTKPIKWPVHPAKTRMHSLIRVFAVRFIDSLGPKPPCGQWRSHIATDQTGRMPRLIWVFVGHTGHFVVLQLVIFFSSRRVSFRSWSKVRSPRRRAVAVPQTPTHSTKMTSAAQMIVVMMVRWYSFRWRHLFKLQKSLELIFELFDCKVCGLCKERFK